MISVTLGRPSHTHRHIVLHRLYTHNTNMCLISFSEHSVSYNLWCFGFPNYYSQLKTVLLFIYHLICIGATNNKQRKLITHTRITFIKYAYDKIFSYRINTISKPLPLKTLLHHNKYDTLCTGQIARTWPSKAYMYIVKRTW